MTSRLNALMASCEPRRLRSSSTCNLSVAQDHIPMKIVVLRTGCQRRHGYHDRLNRYPDCHDVPLPIEGSSGNPPNLNAFACECVEARRPLDPPLSVPLVAGVSMLRIVIRYEPSNEVAGGGAGGSLRMGSYIKSLHSKQGKVRPRLEMGFRDCGARPLIRLLHRAY